MLRILHIIKSLGRGGAEMLLPETLKLHDREKFKFHYAYFLPWKNQVVELLANQKVDVKCFEASNNFQMLLKIPQLVRYINRHKIDVVHAHLPWAGLVGGLAGKKAGIPVFYTEHNNFNRYHFLTRSVSTYSYRNYQQVFMVSGNAFQAASDHFKHHFPCKTDTLLNGVNTDDFQTDVNQGFSIRASLGWSLEHIVIGLAAVYRTQKRIDRWLRIAKQVHEIHPEARFLLVGAGPLQREVDQWVGEYGLNEVVRQVGLQQDVKPFYSAMDIFHMSSDFEGLPIALLEAMSMQLVPVVSRTGGMPEVVDADCGFVYDSEQEIQAVHAISQLLSVKHLLKIKKQTARKRVVDRFDLGLMVNQLEEAYSLVHGSY